MDSTQARYYPDFDRFCRLAQEADLVPVYRRLVSDSLTPVTAFHKLDAGRCSCLAESVVGGEKVGRYSFLATHPFFEIEAYGNRVTINSPSGASASGAPILQTRQFDCDDPLRELSQRVGSLRAATLPELPPFVGGAVGYAGYDVVRYLEHLPNAPPDDRHVPDMAFAFYDQTVVFDHVTKSIVVVALARLDSPSEKDSVGSALRGVPGVEENHGSPLPAERRGGRSLQRERQAYDAACRRVDAVVDRLAAADCDLEPFDINTEGPLRLAYRSNFTQEQFEAAVRKCVEYIRAGDIFQVVPSQRLEVPIRVHPFQIYRTLRVVNPSPFMFYVRTPSVTLVGSSPEIMVRVKDGLVTTRPLAGTRRRGQTDEEDRRLAEELLADPKELAEHIMLVDLGRNDVGRVARYRSVKLSDTMTIERYSHVMHITSNVTGELSPGMTAFDALRACLPAGTVSGAPKVRAMQVIDEVEPHRRGPYAGAVGYFDFNGNMDTCIALRTIVVQDGMAYVQAGAGIVADSVPASEWQETLNKARGLLAAIEAAESQVRG